MISQAKLRAQKLAAWKATPPAKICNPLRFLDGATGSFVRDEKGVPQWTPGKPFIAAERAARRGDGSTVNRLARQVMLGVEF